MSWHVHEEFQVCLAPSLQEVVDKAPDAQQEEPWRVLEMDGEYVDAYLGEDPSDATYQMILNPGVLAASEVNEGSDAGASAFGSALGSVLPAEEVAARKEAGSLRDEMALHGVLHCRGCRR